MEATGETIDFNSSSLKRKRQVRAAKDRAATAGIAIGGISVIIAVMLIFFYLLYEVVPMFRGASMERVASYAVPGGGARTLYLAVEEQAEIGGRVTDAGQVVFFDTRSGEIRKTVELPVPNGITSLAMDEISTRVLAAGLPDGRALIFRHNYRARYLDDGSRVISPVIQYPFGQEPIVVDDQGRGLKNLAVRNGEEALVISAVTDDDRTLLIVLEKEEDFFSGEVTLSRSVAELPHRTVPVLRMLLDPGQRWLFIANERGQLDIFDYRDRASPVQNSRIQLVDGGAQVTSLEFLLGGISLLVGDSTGTVSQWFLVRDSSNQYQLEKIRSFSHDTAPILEIAIEHRRKGFAAIDANGVVGLYNTTAHRDVHDQPLFDVKPAAAAMAPRANALLAQGADGQVHFWKVHNEHPEVSWSALWDEVWYESYDEPKYVWQSSSASNDFEPKFSLMPLAFGTLKAAFYAMLLAAPLAVCGAMYTAFFMSASLRRKVKPIIELMEALPTVILGFLAGLWLAPFVEKNLPGVFSLLLLTPIAILVAGYVWTNLPARIRYRVPEGWYPVLVVPVVIIAAWLSIASSPTVEAWFFDGDMRAWLSNDLGIAFDQRNALVVGLAMGFAVIPTIFSIAEDALFSVPRHLVNGSLALGATPWQTLVRVVLPTASPGIFSGLMIGLGRAVGETMIVLMATGNTPIMDANIFEGMRTLAANIAVEMPESEVGSTHYRILFLAAFVLFLFTFVFNTLAEIVRQRLRVKYGSL